MGGSLEHKYLHSTRRYENVRATGVHALKQRVVEEGKGGVSENGNEGGFEGPEEEKDG